MKKMVRILKKMVNTVEDNGAKVNAINVDNEQILIVAKFKGITFEYGYNAKSERLVVTFDGEIIEEMYYKF